MARVSSDQSKRENAFGRSCAQLRKSMGLTQRAIGRFLGISEQAIQRWEHDVYFPTREHLERLLVLGLQRHAFARGREQEEAHQLWRVAGQQVDFESFWMRAQLAAPLLLWCSNGGPFREQSRLPTRSRDSPPHASIGGMPSMCMIFMGGRPSACSWSNG